VILLGILATGLLAGLLHVLSGPDHLTAVAPYAALHGRRAWRVGLRWGLGHTAGVLLVGAVTLLLRAILPVQGLIERLSAGSERVVGVVLLAIGLWSVVLAVRGRPEGHPHVHSGTSGGGPHVHAAFGVGTLHGLAGGSHILGVLPALAIPSRAGAAGYLLAFGAGSVVGMSAFAALIGLLALTPAGRSDKGLRALAGVCGVAAIGVGLLWLSGRAF
jgi:hypothetical protein